MTVVSVHDAQTHLSRLIEQVLAGEEVVIAGDAQAVVRMVRVQTSEPSPKKPLLGSMKGRMADVGDEAMVSLPDEYLEIDKWGNRPL